MDSFEGKRAVVTGGGSGMGRELVVQLAAAGCSVATCDVNPSGLAETVAKAEAGAPTGTRITSHVCDVSDESQVLAFHDEVVKAHGEVLELVFNNAGIGGGASFISDSREDWERTFAVDFWGVYYCTRAFLQNLIAASEAVLVNTSSVNGFWASIGPGMPHTAYSTAKFAVKGLSESLIEDFRVNAPHVRVAVVMPGHIGTDIVANSRRYFGRPEPDALSDTDVEEVRTQIARRGIPADQLTTEQLRDVVKMIEEGFRNSAPLDAGGAARIILEGVKSSKWRILVGDDAHRLDEAVRADPEGAYDHKGVGISPLTLGEDLAGG
ncbi:MAG TPA: SDR family NAD(P)-dependent oxidoreductase [Acidimicrobiales bacterium]|nr:SDR family NAD(P)-dependent oxidoreductase [Acidimicrobiales bacterium]